MYKQIDLIRIITAVLLLCSMAFAVETAKTGVQRQPGLVPSTQHNFQYGNDILTGNVSGGKHFRGVVPYRSTSEFYGNLPSAALNSFYRNSAPINYGAPLSSQPYYLPSKMVTNTARATSSPPTMPLISQNYGASELVPAQPGLPTYSRRLDTTQIMPVGTYSKPGPLSIPTNELEKKFEKELEVRKTMEGKTPGTKLAGKIDTADKLYDPAKPFTPEDYGLNPAKPSAPDKKNNMTASQTDVWQQMIKDIKSRADKLQQVISEKAQDESAKVSRPDLLPQSQTETGGEPAAVDANFSRLIVDLHKTFAADNPDKFNHYMRTAETLMHEGKYYRAADAYTLASVFKKDDPLPFAGRGHALFAAGEYMSSAYFLLKGLSMFPEYAVVKVDLVSMIGDKDKIESRLADLAVRQQQSKSPELAFLQAYICYQMGRFNDAKAAMDAAIGTMGYNDNVRLLQQVIDETIKPKN